MAQAATKKKPHVKGRKAQPKPKTATPRVSKAAIPARRKRVLTPLGVTLLSVIGLILIAGAVFSAVALTYDKIYPNISAYGIDFGGMTREEAEASLTEHLAGVYLGKSVELSLDGHSVTVTSEEAGAFLSPAKTAEALFDQGRSRNAFSRVTFAVSSLFSQRVVEDANDFYIDRGAVEDIVSSLSGGLYREPVEYTWEIVGNAIEVSGGHEGASSDPGKMTDAVIEGFKTLDFSPLSFYSKVIPPAPLPLEDLHSHIFVASAEAYIILNDDDQAAIVPHVTGISFDMEKARGLLDARTGKFTIPLLYTVPDITAASLEENLFRDLLGSYSTSTAGSSHNRVTNIDLTAKYMTGTIILPGEDFSFNDAVGNRTEDRGFKMAGSYLNGKIVDAIGGGVCQSSTTLYNAVLLSNLHIVSRQGHSMTVAYVPLGRDAAVDWGRIDFVFSNDTAYPIRVEAWYASSRLTVQIWGTKTDDLTVSIENQVLSHRPAQTITEFNPSLAPGDRHTKASGSDGWTVQTYRVLKDPDGNIVYRNPEARTGYMKVDTVIEVGIPPGGGLPDEPASADPIDPINPDDPAPAPSPDPEPEPNPTPELPDDPDEPVSTPYDRTEEDEHDLQTTG